MSKSQDLTSLFQKYQSLSETQQRAVASVVGSAVADAATRPLHWLYDRKVLEESIGENDPAFWPVNLSPFYEMPTGQRSCYNDMGYTMLRSLPSKSSEPFEVKNFLESFEGFFKAPSEYATALALRLEAYDPAK